jgi:hypothetical protein
MSICNRPGVATAMWTTRCVRMIFWSYPRGKPPTNASTCTHGISQAI